MLPGCSTLVLHYFSASVSRREGSAGPVCLSGRRLASCLFFFLFISSAPNWHMFGRSWYRPVGGKVEGLMDRCEACDACLTSKIHFLGVVKRGGTSGLYGLIKLPYIYTVDTHWWRPLRPCLREETLLFFIQKSVCLVLILVFQTFRCAPPPQREQQQQQQLSGPARAHPQTPIKLC